jgi:uncharacterized membrane protein
MISSSVLTVILWLAVLSSGLMGGVYFAFSGFIMPAFKEIDSAHAIAAMNSINEIILRSLFMPLFFGSSFISVLLIVLAVSHWGETGSVLMLIAGAVYFVGMFMCTAFFNVPLNNTLAKTKPYSADAQLMWSHFLKSWTNWNHLRSFSSLLTCVLCTWVLSSS